MAEYSIYKPGLEFANYGLLVSFDHALKAKPEELDYIDGPITCFVVHPERELYVGLQLVSKRVLFRVAVGLRDYQEDESFNDNQRKLIRHGADRLGLFLRTERLV